MTNTFNYQPKEKQLSKEVKTMTAKDVSFAKQFNGYDRDEVDLYIKNLTQAYQMAYEEYNALCAKYNNLLAEYTTLDEQQEQSKSSVAIIAKTLVDTETLAHKIIADAQAEADKVKTETQAAAQKIREDAYVEKAAVKIQTQKLIDDTKTETDEAKKRARKIINDAQAEAAQLDIHAKRNLEQADESIALLVNNLQELLRPKRGAVSKTDKTHVKTEFYS